MKLTPEQAAEKRKLIEKIGIARRGHHDNRIQFFGIVDPVRADDHKECCRLFRGPNPIQKKLLDAWGNPEYKVFSMTGANRIGKTTTGVVIAISTMLGKFPWNESDIRFSHGFPRKVRYVGQDWEKHIKAVVEPDIHKWWPKGRKVITKKNNFGVDSLWTDELTGSTLEIMSNNQDPDLHEGWSGDLVIYDEPPKRDIRVANARGLVDRCGRELFVMTLLKEAWVDREVIRATLPDGSPDASYFHCDADISVNLGFGLTQEGVNQFSKTLTEDEKQSRLNGIPSYLSSLIYGKFKRDVHLKNRFKIPLDWIVDIAIDFHPSKPWAVLFLATGKNGFKWVIDEIFQHGSYKAIAEEIVRRISYQNLRVGNIIIDPLSKGDEQSDLHEESVFRKMSDIFSSFGFDLYTASKDKASGINMVQDLLMTENELPGLFFFKGLPRVIMEIEGYMTDPNTGLPSKENDDMMENLYRLVLLGTEYSPINYNEDTTVSFMNKWLQSAPAESWM